MKNLNVKHLTMIVPVFNGMKFIDAFIQPFNRYKYSWNIVFVDNGSNDGSLEYLESICKHNSAWQLLSFTDKKSSYAARNYGASIANGSIFLFTDIDCILTENYFDFVSTCKFKDDSLISGPTNIFLKTKNIYEYFDKCTYLTQENYLKQNYAATANLIVGRDLFEKARGFPEFTSGADNKFCQNCFDLGAQICFAPELIVKHPPRASLDEHLVKARRLGIGHGESFLDMNLGYFANLLMIVKQLVLTILPVHSLRLFFRVLNHKRFSVIEMINLIKLCYLVGFFQRLHIVFTIVKRS